MEVTNEMIAQWKEKHKKIFTVTLDSVKYYFTTFKRDTYVDLLAKQAVDPNFNYEFAVLKACIVHPQLPESFEDDIQVKSGLGVVLLEQIMIKSGWEQVQAEEL